MLHTQITETRFHQPYRRIFEAGSVTWFSDLIARPGADVEEG